MMWEAGICDQLSNESLLRHLKKWLRYVPKAAAPVKANEVLAMATIVMKEEAKGSMKEQAILDLSTQIEYLKSLSWRHRGDHSGCSVAEREIRPLE